MVDEGISGWFYSRLLVIVRDQVLLAACVSLKSWLSFGRALLLGGYIYFLACPLLEREGNYLDDRSFIFHRSALSLLRLRLLPSCFS